MFTKLIFSSRKKIVLDKILKIKMKGSIRIKILLERKEKRKEKKKEASPGGLEPPTFRYQAWLPSSDLTAERANRLRHGDTTEWAPGFFNI